MDSVSVESDRLVDGMPRDRRGFWQPEDGIAPPNPLFSWPLRAKPILKWFWDYLYPWNLIYMGLAAATYYWMHPTLEQTQQFTWEWILFLFLRNQIMLILIVSAWHVHLWRRKAQGLEFKYTTDWMATGKKQFLWGNQLWDNVFWSCVSGGITWTAYEVLMQWAAANGYLLFYIEPAQSPVLFAAVLLLIPLWRLFHFYWAHRLLHVPILYKAGHYLHHRNINIGPWSGLSMHPIEHVLYFSCVLIHFVVPSHPIHFILNLQHASFTPAQGHVGFETVKLTEDKGLPAGSYFHQLHHRYFECNYGEQDFPFDSWFGTAHDGSPEAHAAMRAKRRAVHQV